MCLAADWEGQCLGWGGGGGGAITPRCTALMSDITGEHESAALLLDVKHWDTLKEFWIL